MATTATAEKAPSNSKGSGEKKTQRTFYFCKDDEIGGNKRSKKRKTKYTIFTNKKKLNILDEVDQKVFDQKVTSVNAIIEKYNIGRKTLHGWRKNREALRKDVEDEGKGDKKRLFLNDGLKRIKVELRAFYELNETMPEHLKIPITQSVIAKKAFAIKQKLLEANDRTPILSEAEINAIVTFKASESWAGKFARQNGWTPHSLQGEGGGVNAGAADAVTEKIQKTIQESDEDAVHNMDVTDGDTATAKDSLNAHTKETGEDMAEDHVNLRAGGETDEGVAISDDRPTVGAGHETDENAAIAKDDAGVHVEGKTDKNMATGEGLPELHAEKKNEEAVAVSGDRPHTCAGDDRVSVHAKDKTGKDMVAAEDRPLLRATSSRVNDLATQLQSIYAQIGNLGEEYSSVAAGVEEASNNLRSIFLNAGISESV